MNNDRTQNTGINGNNPSKNHSILEYVSYGLILVLVEGILALLLSHYHEVVDEFPGAITGFFGCWSVLGGKITLSKFLQFLQSTLTFFFLLCAVTAVLHHTYAHYIISDLELYDAVNWSGFGGRLRNYIKRSFVRLYPFLGSLILFASVVLVTGHFVHGILTVIYLRFFPFMNRIVEKSSSAKGEKGKLHQLFVDEARKFREGENALINAGTSIIVVALIIVFFLERSIPSISILLSSERWLAAATSDISWNVCTTRHFTVG